MVLRNGHGVEIGTTGRVRVSMSFFSQQDDYRHCRSAASSVDRGLSFGLCYVEPSGIFS